MHLFYPSLCMGCGTDALATNQPLCLRCLKQLPHTAYELKAGNPIEKIFTGRLDLEAATSQLYFTKGKLVQHLMHQLKYKNNKTIGFYLGEIMGNSLLESSRFSNLDYLIPLPLYPEKEFKRGYNQAEIICNGISASMQVPVLTKNICRQRATQTQTRKHRTERWENVAGSFVVKDPGKIMGTKLLLVDDVITTGATLEACGQVIKQVPGTALSICTLATASK